MKTQELSELRNNIDRKKESFKKRLCVCCGAGCISSGSEPVLDAAKHMIAQKGMEDTIEVVPTGCMGPCNQGPLVKVLPDNTIYQRIAGDNVEEIVDQHVLHDQPVRNRILFSDTRKETPVDTSQDPFFAKQRKIVLENCGRINPEDIEDYIAADGYKALQMALHINMPEEILSEIKHSRLRGRGGAGFPTGLKWETVYKHVSDQKFVICNGDEGDPGAFMDRSVLEGDPHRVLEGMIIAGYAVGANKGYLYVRAEYPLAIKRLELAIRQARKLGLLGNNIMESGFHFDVEIRIGAGAFVCGEETALIASIEGRRGLPRPRPPFPAESGLWGKPTLINNVETFANVVPIVRRGGEWFSEIGTPKSSGTKVFALAGKILHSGLIEVPMGTSLKKIIFDIGGGIPDGGRFKAAQTGGPSGGCIPEKYLDTPVDYESLMSLGSIMGSGGLIVMDEHSNMPDVARFFMEFCMDESCGRCVPCRVGTRQMYDLLTRICEGNGTRQDLDLLEEIAPFVKETSLCGLGVSAPNPLLSTLNHFRSEYDEKINGSAPSASRPKSPAASTASDNSDKG